MTDIATRRIRTPIDPALLRSWVELETTRHGLLPHRLPAWARSQWMDLDGRSRYGDADHARLPLPDGLHPDTPTHRLIGDRFLAAAFGVGMPFGLHRDFSRHIAEREQQAHD